MMGKYCEYVKIMLNRRSHDVYKTIRRCIKKFIDFHLKIVYN